MIEDEVGLNSGSEVGGTGGISSEDLWNMLSLALLGVEKALIRDLISGSGKIFAGKRDGYLQVRDNFQITIQLHKNCSIILVSCPYSVVT